MKLFKAFSSSAVILCDFNFTDHDDDDDGSVNEWFFVFCLFKHIFWLGMTKFVYLSVTLERLIISRYLVCRCFVVRHKVCVLKSKESCCDRLSVK